jgi:hypothetical protein
VKRFRYIAFDHGKGLNWANLALSTVVLMSIPIASNGQDTEGPLRQITASSLITFQDKEVLVDLSAIGGTHLRAIGGTHLRADDTADVQAIGGTHLRAIGGTHLRADDTADIQAIGGTHLRAIGGTHLRAIGGTHLRADDTADVQAIGGTHLRAIGGTYLRAIGGTHLRADDTADIQAIGGTHLRAIGGTHLRSAGLVLGDSSFQSLLLGPIDRIDYSTGSITVLGQAVKLGDGADAEGETVSDSLATGQIVAVFGCSGSSEAAIVIFADQENFVAGVTEIVIGSTVTSTSSIEATFQIDGFLVDYSQLLAEDSAPTLTIGDYVIVRGVLY